MKITLKRKKPNFELLLKIQAPLQTEERNAKWE
jgi:hypothetical protein